MAEAIPFHQEDSAGLVVALALHAAVVALLLLQPPMRELAQMPPRMTVSLATEVGLEATAPDPVAESRMAIAPTLADTSTPPSEEAPGEAAPDTPSPPPAPTRRSAAAPTQPTPPARERERSRPDRTPAPPPSPAQAARPAQGSRIGDDFLSGAGDSSKTDETRAPAAAFGRSERAALASAITRQLRPHWTAPTGADAELLVSLVSWKLNPDGTLKGRPTCRNEPSSITDSNRPQAALHCERAIRAVQLAAPFNLPEQFYSRWDDLEWQFDRRL